MVFTFLESKGSNAPSFFKQHNGFFGGFFRQLLMLGAVGDFLRIVRVNVRILKQSQAELRREDAAHGLIHLGDGNSSILYLLHQGAVDGAIGQIEIDAGGERFSCGFGGIGGHTVSAVQHLQAFAIGGDVAGESPLLAQDLFE